MHVFRVSQQDEIAGLDEVKHKEKAYEFGEWRERDVVERVKLIVIRCPRSIIGKLLQVPNNILPFTPPPPLRD